MAKLLGVERNGNLVDKYWLHSGDDGKDRITVETVQDVEPIFKHVHDTAQTKGKDFRFVASIPENLVNETAKQSAALWGCSVKDAYAELMSSKTDRAKAVWKTLTQGRDYRKLQARHYVA